MIYILAAKIDRTFLFAKQAGIKCALLSLISHLEVLAHPPIPATRAHPPSHRLAVAGVFDEGGGAGAVAASDGDCDVTGWFGWWLLHFLLVVLLGISRRPRESTRRFRMPLWILVSIWRKKWQGRPH